MGAAREIVDEIEAGKQAENESRLDEAERHYATAASLGDGNKELPVRIQTAEAYAQAGRFAAYLLLNRQPDKSRQTLQGAEPARILLTMAVRGFEFLQKARLPGSDVPMLEIDELAEVRSNLYHAYGWLGSLAALEVRGRKRTDPRRDELLKEAKAWYEASYDTAQKLGIDATLWPAVCATLAAIATDQADERNRWGNLVRDLRLRFIGSNLVSFVEATQLLELLGRATEQRPITKARKLLVQSFGLPRPRRTLLT